MNDNKVLLHDLNIKSGILCFYKKTLIITKYSKY